MDVFHKAFAALKYSRPAWIARALWRDQIHPSAAITFSQEGEDVLIDRYFRHKKTGFYVDIGAHHPVTYSNTWKFYSRGWNGINIDPLPGTADIFRKRRPRDLSFEVGVGLTRGNMVYHQFRESVLNTFDADLAKQRERDGAIKICEILVNVLPLGELLHKEVPPKQIIDFMTIDVEGLDLDVIKSNDWDVFRPQLIIAEILDSSINDVMFDPVSEFLFKQGYQAISKLHYSVVFEKQR